MDGSHALPGSLSPLSGLRLRAAAQAVLLLTSGPNGDFTCVAVDIDPAAPSATATAALLGATLLPDPTFATARRQNRPMMLPSVDLPFSAQTGKRARPTNLAAWSLVLPVLAGRDGEAWIVLLSDLPRSATEAATLAGPAARVASQVVRAAGAASIPDQRSRSAVSATGDHVRAQTPVPVANDSVGRPGAPLGVAEDAAIQFLFSVYRDGAIIVDSDGAIVAANDVGRQLLSSLQSASGDRIEHPTLRALHEGARERAERREVEIDVAGEQHRLIMAGIVPAPFAGHAVLTLRDIAVERLIQQRLLQSEKMASIGQLVSGVAHELNNPLTGIMGFAQLLLTRDLPDRVRREITTIKDEAERASRIVQNLLSFSRRRRPEKERVNLNLIIDRVLALRTYELQVHNIEPRLHLDRDLPWVLADPHQIQQVLLNVIGNAEQAVKHGGGVIDCSTSFDGHRVSVVIADDGIGISRQNLKRVFDPFFTTKPIGEGTGLGLTISYAIIEEHGGEITIDSEPGKGTSVSIALTAAEPAPPESPNEASLPGGGVADRRRILVVDDELSIRALLHSMLTEAGHQVETAGDGVSALELLAREDFDAIISDVKMPGIDGIELYRRVSAWDPDVASRIIFTSGDMLTPATRAFLESIDNPHLAKPFHLLEMRSLIDGLLAR